jgi:hypothetical protein
MALALLLIALLAAGAKALNITCTYEASDGSYYDLTPFMKYTQATYYSKQGGDEGGIYYMSPCNTLDFVKCRPEAPLCYRDNYMGWWSLGAISSWTWKDYTPPSGGVVVSLKNGAYGCAYNQQLPLSATISIKCDPTVTGDGGILSVKEDSCHYYVEMATSHACPKPNPNKPGITITAIILIVILCVVVAYFVLGALINWKAREKSGAEIIPNYGFWSGLGGLLKDGVLFVTTCGKHAGYESV